MDRLEQKRPYWRKEADQLESDGKDSYEEFQDRHSTFSDKVERLLLQLVILGLVALVLVQAFQLNRFTRLVAMEGVSVGEVTTWSRTLESEPVQTVSAGATQLSLKVMVITRRSVPEARILVDGKTAGDFGNGTVALQVRPGQVIAIDASRVAEPLAFRVVEVSGLSAPALGTTITTRGDQKRLGVVKGR